MGECAGHEHKHQNRGDGFQGTDEQGAEFADPCHVRHDQGKDGAGDQADNDADDQLRAIIFVDDGFDRS